MVDNLRAQAERIGAEFAATMRRRAMDEARRVAEDDEATHRALRAVFWTAFRACLSAMLLWSIIDKAAQVLVNVGLGCR